MAKYDLIAAYLDDATKGEQELVETARIWRRAEDDRDYLAKQLAWGEVRSIGMEYLHDPAHLAKDVAQGEITGEEGALWEALLTLMQSELRKAYTRIKHAEEEAQTQGKDIAKLVA